MNKLCIFSAGRGTRNNNVDGLHKALLPIENKPTISHIIEKFDKNVEIVSTEVNINGSCKCDLQHNRL